MVSARTSAADPLAFASASFGGGGTSSAISTSSVTETLEARSGSVLEIPGAYGLLEVNPASRGFFGDLSTASGKERAPTRSCLCSAPRPPLVEQRPASEGPAASMPLDLSTADGGGCCGGGGRGGRGGVAAAAASAVGGRGGSAAAFVWAALGAQSAPFRRDSCGSISYRSYCFTKSK